ncbi:fumarylacetoacetate hydrolase family protein [Erythrobacter rubeus]|uniref:Fumarylacetoacetate hydrolase family protein n=1 Tax=Erythrobacter rubeus TaxID=2760803 RepID=A0ABR8KUF3_9SPHN|nr:fumarylacetoacetate hydrolase family protein [Erythrobacter rubeus]MBD2841887.1 fumarylacetoacetate hydrolase family protein [Erythrobacter rubeus]
MKLATFRHGGKVGLGVVESGDGSPAIRDLRGAEDIAGDMIALMNGGESALDQLRTAAADAPAIALDEVELLAPVLNPGKILAIGLNYADHIKESGMGTPEHQIWFNKQRTCVNGPYADINMPAVSDKLDFEAEMVTVIGKTCKHVPRERAHEVVFGFTCGNDVSVRDWQLRTPTMTIGKSFDTHGPTGPWIVTPDELEDCHNVGFICTVNGEEKQRSNTKHLVFDVYDQIVELTKAFTLEPGDLIFTGTSGGVGVAKKPPEFLEVGDVVRIEFDGIGHIENRVARENAETRIG